VTLNEAEESGRRQSKQPSLPITNTKTNNNHVQYNIQFNNSSGTQTKHITSYDDYNRDIIDSTAAAIDSFDNEPIQKYTGLSTISPTGDNHSSAPNVYSYKRTSSKSASAKIRNSLIMSMNSNIPLSSTNNNNNQHGVTSVNENSMMTNPNVSYRYSYQSQVSMPQPQPQSQQSQTSQPQQILPQNHYTMYQTPSTMPQPPPPQPPQAVLMDTQYNSYMFEQQQHQHQQNEIMKKYNEAYLMNSNAPNKSQISDNNQYMIYKSNGSGISYGTSELYNQKRASNNSYNSNNLMINTNTNPNNGNPTINTLYKQPLHNKCNSSINLVNDWHNKELPPLKIPTKPNSGDSHHIIDNNNNSHSANEVLYQHQQQYQYQQQQLPSPPNPVSSIYTNSPIKINTNPMTSNNRLSMNNTINGSNSQFDSPLDAPPRLTKLFGYMPSEIVSPIKINDDYQQDLQKMEDVTNNFYLSPLNSQSTRSPTITQSFSNLHINTNVSSAGNTPLRSYTNSAGSTPNGSAVVLNNISSISSGHLSAAMDPSVSISPLANKASNLSLSVSFFFSFFLLKY